MPNIFRFGGAGSPQETDYEQIVNYTFLYDEGDECTDVTGGWAASTNRTSGYFDKVSSGATSVKTKKSNGLYIAATSPAGTIGQASFEAKNKIDLSRFARFQMKGSNDSGAMSGPTCFLSDNPFPGSGEPYAASKAYFGMTKSYDISSVESAYMAVSVIVYKADGKASGGGTVNYIWLTKEDDHLTWSAKAGLTATDLDTLVADEASMGVLMNSEEAIKYMVKRCTGTAMVAVLQSEVGKAALAASPYLVEVIANEHWAKFIMRLAPELLNYTMLYDYGEKHPDHETQKNGNAIMTDENDHILMQNLTSSSARTLYYVKKDLTDYCLCKARTRYNGNKNISVNLFITTDTSLVSETIIKTDLYRPISTNAEEVWSFIDVSDLQGEFYVMIGQSSGAYTWDSNIYNISLLKNDNYLDWTVRGQVIADDMATLIADSAKMTALMLSEDAVDYLCGCTGDLMASIVASETAVAAIVGSAYATAKLTAHPVWRKFIAMSPVCEDAGLTAIL